MDKTRSLAGISLLVPCLSATAATDGASRPPQDAGRAALTWSQASTGSGATALGPLDLTYGGGRFVAVGGTAPALHFTDVLTSSDGLTWKVSTLDPKSGGSASVVYGGGAYLVVGNAGWFSSTDAMHWSAVPAHPARINGMVYGSGKFLTFAGTCPGAQCLLATSHDGRSWDMAPVPTALSDDGATRTYTFDGTRFISIGEVKTADSSSSLGNAPVFTSCDGATWTHSADISVSSAAVFTGVYPVSDGLIATGYLECTGEGSDCLEPTSQFTAKSPDSTRWDAQPLDYTMDDHFFSGVISTSIQYYATAIDGDASFMLTSMDGYTWTPAPGVPATADTLALAAGGGRIVAAGAKGMIISAPASDIYSPKSGACTDLPAVDNGSSGSFDLLSLASLLGLLLWRRRWI